MATNKRKQDEKHLKMLREMVSLAHNKQCFDCGQRGPTYVNVTLGSYVCTSCSGALRGLNPPHRVKSISMTSFSAEEMDFLVMRGNEYCRQVWLGLYDARSQPTLDSRDEQKLKDFLANKYEKKRWYVAPTESMAEEAKQMNSVKKTTDTKPLRSIGGTSLSKLVVNSQQPPTTSTPPTVRPPAGAVATPLAQASQQVPSSQPAKTSGTMDLLGDLGGDPFAAPTTAPPGGGFADFGSFGQTQASSSFTAQPTRSAGFPQPQSNPTTDLFANFASPQASNTASTAPTIGDSNKYTNLADLFSSPAPEPVSTVNWDGGAGGINWQGGNTTTPSGSLFGSGGTSLSTAMGPSSNSAMFGGQQVNTPFGGQPNTGVSQSWDPTNPFVQTAAANPFGGLAPSSQAVPLGGSNPLNQPGSSVNPFLSSGSVPGGVASGFPQQSSFNQPMASSGFTSLPVASNPSLSTAGMQNGSWGQAQPHNQMGLFGQQPVGGAGGQMMGKASQGGFGSAGMFGVPQQGGFGAPPPQQMGVNSGFGGQQQFASWGQPSQSVNPFMNVAPQQTAPPSNSSTNPFL